MPHFEGPKYTTIDNPNPTGVAGDEPFNFANGRLLFIQHMTGSPLPQAFRKKPEKHILSQHIIDLPRARAAYDDYVYATTRYVVCLKGTREALLEEIAKWILSLTGPRLYLLWGIAGVGKSTVAQTVAERADNLHSLGASFFFSRDQKNARMFFTTIAFQLCVYNRDFCCAIGEVLLTERGRTATSIEPLEELNTLILGPLRNLNYQFVLPIVIVVDALDECDDQDGPTIFIGLARLVQELPFFRVILTSRPLLHLQHLIDNPSIQTEFHLQNIEDNIVDNDIRLYLEHGLSSEHVQLRLLALRNKWSVSHQEIESLVQNVGRLFIIASMAVRFILDTVSRNPKSRMKSLLDQFAHNRIPFHALNEFYTVILRSIVPRGAQPDVMKQYQLVVGTIVLVQEPLPVEALAVLIGLPEESVYAVLDNLQSVISISRKNIPLVYHKSFSNYLTDDTCCEDVNFRIVPRIHHTRIAARCLQLINKYLEQKILYLGTPASFMDNNDGLVNKDIPAEKLAEMIPAELRYACIFWPNHITHADVKDVSLMKAVDTFVTQHLLHWLAALNCIRKLDTACPASSAITMYMKSAPGDLSMIISNVLYRIPKLYRHLHQSTLHSALPFTLLYHPSFQSYSEEAIDVPYLLEGVQPPWDAQIAHFSSEIWVHHLIFSHDSVKFASSSRCRQEMTLCDAENGTCLRTYKGDSMAIAHDFSMVAVSKGRRVALWSVPSNALVATFTHSSEVVELTLSFDGSRLAVGLFNGTVSLWDVGKSNLMVSLDNYAHDGGQIGFAPSGYRLAFLSGDGTVQLWNGDDGGSVARLDYESKKHVKFVFSCDGCRLASLVKEGDECSLALWDGEKGTFISAAPNVGGELTISEDGSLIATGGRKPLQLWSGNPLSLVDTLDIGGWIRCLAISRGILAIGSVVASTLTLYDINNRTVIVTLRVLHPLTLALSPDCTRLATGDYGGALFDVSLLRASVPASKQLHRGRVTSLTFSPDSSRLSSGIQDGTIELWDTSRTDYPIANHKLHSEEVGALTFSLDGEQFASVSGDQTIRFWGGRDGAPISKLGHSFTGVLTSAAFSRDLLAVATSSSITIFDRESLSLSNTFDNGSHSLSFSPDGSLLASASRDDRTRTLTIWSIAERAAVATFTVEPDVYKLPFLPGDSHLAAEWTGEEGSLKLFDIANERSFELIGREDLSWVPHFINEVLASRKESNASRNHLIGRFLGCQNWIPMLWIPRGIDIQSFAVSPSIFALGTYDSQILFIRFPPTNIN